MNHVDVFTGIAGFALAAQQVWGDDYENICFCDNNKFCQEVIKKNFGKESLIYGDIREVTKERIIADTKCMRKLQQKGGKQDKRRRTCYEIDLLTGGPPCQPFSHAGQRRGKTDDRYLWPEMLRVIKELKPHWIIVENVAGILSMAQQQGNAEMGYKTDNADDNTDVREASGIIWDIIGDIEQADYTVQTFVIPACAINAPHRRDRVWIVAYNAAGIRYRKKNKIQTGRLGIELSSINAPDTSRRGLQRASKKYFKISSQAQNKRSKQTNWTSGQDTSWNQNWLKVATKFCGVDDGLPVGLDGFKLTKAGHRVERLKALGNAIVPQVAIEIMRAIKEIDYERLDK